MSNRIYNFSAGPAILPEEVLGEAKEALLSYKNCGLGICEMSHRSEFFKDVIEQAKANLKQLLNVSDDFEVLFLQGGASMQFHMIPLNLAENKTASYVNTGAWAKKAIKEAGRLGEVNVVASSEDKNFCYIPAVKNDMISKDSAYLHYTSNNTIFGTEFQSEPDSNGALLVCDASSDFLSRKINLERYGLIYAGAQKNIGPAGVTVVLISKEMIDRSNPDLPPMLSYANHAKSESMFNTPPAFSIYVVGLVLKWLKKLGGMEVIEKMNQEKAGLLYDFMDASAFFKPTAEKSSRSLMNVTFRLPSEDLEKKFIKDALTEGFSGLKGHRSVGGVRASIYNAFPKQGVIDIIRFMKDFESNNG